MTDDSHFDSSTWLIDSGASNHVTKYRDYLRNYSDYATPRVIKLGGDQRLLAYGEGRVRLRVESSRGDTNLTLTAVLFGPKMRRNLISMASLMLDNWSITATKTVLHLNRDLATLEVPMVDGLFALRARTMTVPAKPQCMLTSSRTLTLQGAHETLAHIDKRRVKEFLTREGIAFKDDKITCTACIRGKMNRASYRSKPASVAPQSLGYISTDLCGPMPTADISGAKYFMNMHDQYSRFNRLFLLKSKDEAITCI
jgi:hypothetical protein